MNRRAHTFLAGTHQDEHTATLADSLSGFLRATGLSKRMRHPRLWTAWRETVGDEIGQHTQVSGFRRGVLEVAVDSSALMSEIQFHRKALLRDIRSQGRDPFISQISFVLQPPKGYDAE